MIVARIIPAIKGKLGSTEYYAVTMKALDAVNYFRVPKEENLGIEERYQREINETRVKKVIAPYLATDPDRFFGALIVSIMNADNIAFEGITDVAPKMPQAYKMR